MIKFTCEMCGTEGIAGQKNKRFCGSQGEKGSCTNIYTNKQSGERVRMQRLHQKALKIGTSNRLKKKTYVKSHGHRHKYASDDAWMDVGCGYSF